MNKVIDEVQTILSRYSNHGRMSNISIVDTLKLMNLKEQLEKQIAERQILQTNEGNKSYISERRLQVTKMNLLKSSIVFIIALIGFNFISFSISPFILAFVVALIWFGAIENRSTNEYEDKAIEMEEQYQAESFYRLNEDIAMIKQNVEVIDSIVTECSIVPMRYLTMSVLSEMLSYKAKGFVSTDGEAISRYIDRNFS